jgi:hypothetical protein
MTDFLERLSNELGFGKIVRDQESLHMTLRRA